MRFPLPKQYVAPSETEVLAESTREMHLEQISIGSWDNGEFHEPGLSPTIFDTHVVT